MDNVDFSPRRVWLGLSIPGKKMFRMGADAAHRGSMLIDCYKGAPSEALLYAAIGLHLLPEQGAQFGPASRDLRKPLRPGSLYGAILTDIRDFLKFRYRAEGLANGCDTPILQTLKSGEMPEGVEPSQPDLVINYAVTALDALSKDPEFVKDREMFLRAIYALRDLLEQTAKFLHRLEVGEENWEKWAGRQWDEFLPWKRDEPDTA